MRHACLISVSFILSSKLLADTMTTTGEYPTLPPDYQMLRFDENYSCLSNAVNRTDLFDPIKFIPLRANDPTWYLTVGGEFRERFEGNYNQNFGIGGLGQNSYLLQRITLLTDWHFGERVRFFVEGISGIMEGESLPAPPVNQDQLDLQFAFLELIPYLTADEKLALRVGRFGMSFGSGRLVATRAATNIPFRFDGLELIYTSPLWETTAFLTQPAADTGGINGEDHSTTFWGLYATRYFDHARTLGLDLYYLGIDNKYASYVSGTADETRHSFGAREFGSRGGLDWNAEQVVQTGTFGDNSILAWTAAIDSGYTFDTDLQPRLGIKSGIASGSHSTTGGTMETFDALYFKSGYFNDASLLRPQNIIGVHPNLTLQLSRKIEVDGGGNVFWRYSKHDAVYAVPGFVAIPASATASSYVGTAADINFTWQIQRHLSLQASYVHFFAGSYIHGAGGGDVNYVSTTFTFLF
ncbi:MAG TPA: alginate export family protein [Candidatus Acidoferrales bacterium]|nr:alginate export family protein [Candidatus Acidoferrales bacterium]